MVILHHRGGGRFRYFATLFQHAPMSIRAAEPARQAL
jgi:hypothetical protein